MIVARRVYLYGIAFASLWMIVYGLAGLVQVALEGLAEVLLGPLTTVGTSRLADRVSFNVALSGIGLVTWLIHWGLAQRAARRDGRPELGSAIRKLYLYAVLLVSGLILTFTLRTLLADLLEVAFGLSRAADIVSGDLVGPLATLLSTGAFWGYHARVVARDRAGAPEIGAGATLRRWCVYILAFVGLLTLIFGTVGLLSRLVELAAPTTAATADSGRWLAASVAGRAGSMLAGLAVWALAWRWSTRLFDHAGAPDPERDSVLRKVYLYAVLLVAVSWTVWSVGQVLYVLLRSLLLPGQAGALWTAVQRDLGETASNVLVFGIAWAYHAAVVRREAAAAPEHHRQATIRWLYGYLLSLVGGVTFGFGVGGTLATLLDLLVSPGESPYTWWQERLSLYATLIVVGAPVWLMPWTRLQREVMAQVARRSLARRVYLFLVLGLCVLTLLGSGAFTLYQILRVLLGEDWTGAETSDLVSAVSAAAIAGLMLAYHARVFQRDARLAQDDAEAASPAPSIAAGGGVAADADGLVTLLVVRLPAGSGAGGLRERLADTIPAGATVETVRLPVADAARLLTPRAD